jgi:hypothetical protein
MITKSLAAGFAGAALAVAAAGSAAAAVAPADPGDGPAATTAVAGSRTSPITLYVPGLDISCQQLGTCAAAKGATQAQPPAARTSLL